MFPQGRFWYQVLRRAAAARASGALQPLQTEREVIEDSGVRFVVRIASSLARKAADAASQAARDRSVNPFLPYDPNLYVCDVPPAHVCLLNKYNVIDHHLLIVTEHFERQEELLTFRDFEAMWTCLAEFEGLAFYNGGMDAGASQPHKHLQIVPLPLDEGGSPFPLYPRLAGLAGADEIGRVAEVPFRHAGARLHAPVNAGPSELAELSQATYGLLLDAVGLAPIRLDRALRQGGPYNLLVTREWMLLIPRSKECFGSITVNSLGFAGSFFVKSAAELELLRKYGPMAALKSVTLD